MSCDHTHIHTENGLVQETYQFYGNGFRVTTSIATGIAGEATCLIIHDSNLYPDEDSRSERPNEFIIPIEYADDLKELCKSIKKALKERKKTLIVKEVKKIEEEEIL